MNKTHETKFGRVSPSAGSREVQNGVDATNEQLRAQASEGLATLRRLVPAPDKGPGHRRDPETGFVYYSSEWLSDCTCVGLNPTSSANCPRHGSVAKAPE